MLLTITLLSIPVTVCQADPIDAPFAIVSPIIGAKISSNYGMRRHPIDKVWRHHKGIDFVTPSNSHVRAVAAGTVVYADWYAGYGKLVTIDHGDGYYSLYGHLNELRIDPGKYVKAGGVIGLVGSTGKSTGNHLHFEWRKNGKALDPLKVFPHLAVAAEG